MEPKTNRRLKILFLAHKVPFPPNRGDKIPTFNRIKYLAKNHDIYLVYPSFSYQELEYRRDLEPYVKAIDTEVIKPFNAMLQCALSFFSDRPFRNSSVCSKKLKEKVEERIKNEKIDLVYIYTSSMAQYVEDITGIKKVIDFVDVESDKMRQQSSYTSPPRSWVYAAESERMARYEKEIGYKFSHSIFVSENEKKLYLKNNPDVSASVISNGIDLEYFTPAYMPSAGAEVIDTARNYIYDRNKLVFVGSMDYYPNVDAMIYFCCHIFPLILRNDPDVTLYIVGNNPPKSLLGIGKDISVVVTGYVDDIRPYLTGACVCVVPLRIASGIQHKILEAMACGVPVVTTSRGNEGMHLEDGRTIMIGDNPERFAGCVRKLIADGDFHNNLAYSARNIVEERYKWDIHMSRFESLLCKLVDG